MNTGAVPITAMELATASLLVLLAGGISFGFRLGLEKRLLLASIRTVVQLLLVGYLLKWVFGVDSPWPLLLILGVMIVAASRAAVQRVSRTFPGAHLNTLLTLALVGFVSTFSVTQGVLGVSPWYEPRYVIPLMGMVLGNTLTGISLCMDTLLEQFVEKRALVEADLACGATAREAAADLLRDGVRKGMIPIINTMMVVGIVSLPGMMTGQILQGADPLDAVKYQIVVMFMIAGGTSLGCMVLAGLIYRGVFNERHQLRSDKIRKH